MSIYEEQLMCFINEGVDTGQSWDLALTVLKHLKDDETMEYAKQLLDSANGGMERMFVQNFAFTFSDKGVDFVLETLNREPSKEELEVFHNKKQEIEARNCNQSRKTLVK